MLGRAVRPHHRNTEGEHFWTGWRRCSGLRCNRIGWACSGGVAQWAYSGILIDGTGQVLNPKPISLTSQEIDLHLRGGAWMAGYDWNGSPCTITMVGNGGALDDVRPNEQPFRMLLCKNG
jgi:hypothetical protein